MNEPEWVRDPDKVLRERALANGPYTSGCLILVSYIVLTGIVLGIIGGLISLLRG